MDEAKSDEPDSNEPKPPPPPPPPPPKSDEDERLDSPEPCTAAKISLVLMSMMRASMSHFSFALFYAGMTEATGQGTAQTVREPIALVATEAPAPTLVV